MPGKCGFAVVLLKPSGERKVYRCVRNPDPHKSDGGHFQDHRIKAKSRYEEFAEFSIGADRETDRTHGRCSAWVRFENSVDITQIYCCGEGGHGGFHLPNPPRRLWAWRGSRWIVYSDFPSRSLDFGIGVNYSIGADPSHVRSFELPVYHRPKREAPREPTPEEKVEEACDRVRRRTRDLIEALSDPTDPGRKLVSGNAIRGVLRKFALANGWKFEAR